MTKYEIILESLQEQVDEYILTLEEAEAINRLAHEKYKEEKEQEQEEKLKKVKKKKLIKKIAIGTGIAAAGIGIVTYPKRLENKANRLEEQYKKRMKEIEREELDREKEIKNRSTPEFERLYNETFRRLVEDINKKAKLYADGKITEEELKKYEKEFKKKLKENNEEYKKSLLKKR